MLELIAIIILLSSIAGMSLIIWRKIPVLVTLPTKVKEPRESFFSKLKNKVKILNPLKSFSSEIFLQKILSKIRVLTLKVDNLTGNWLAKLRERVKKKKEIESDNYWEKLKESQNRENQSK